MVDAMLRERDAIQVAGTSTKRLMGLEPGAGFAECPRGGCPVAELMLVARACAPPLAWTADWAQAVQRAAEGESEKAASDATHAARALADHGEPYAAARLLTDLLPFLERDVRALLAERLAASLYAMGAVTSATEAATFD